jgi:HEPN domain-containing protein
MKTPSDRPESADCFNKFDEAFDSLATELSWNASAVEPEPPVPTAARPLSVPGGAPPEQDFIDRCEHAFDALDDRLAQSDTSSGRSRSQRVQGLQTRRRHDTGSLDQFDLVVRNAVSAAEPVVQIPDSPARSTALSKLWSFEPTFGDTVKAAFPSSRSEIAEAGLCFDASRYTASVFHATRAAEVGMRALVRALKRDAAAVTSWPRSIALVEERLAAIESWPHGDERVNAERFFRTALEHAEALLSTVRKLLLTTEQFSEHQAAEICSRIKEFLIALAERISETQPAALEMEDFAS